ncbi:MAG: hypothetical protein Q7J06_03390 [Bacteroidales bacterium]|nr:hypothetical protein [Bacteroidales bacterium]
MTNKLKLSIGDIIFLLIAEKGRGTLKGYAPYHLFLTKNRPEVILRFRYSSDFQGDKNLPGKILFDAQPNWRLCYSNKKYIFQTRDRTAILTPDFTSGEIYITKNLRSFPFTYPLDEILIINLLAQGRGIMVHACGVKDNRRGLLFAGASQAGKSTIANLWKLQTANGKLHNEGVSILSDDRIIIRKMNRQFWMYGTPWHGDANVCSPEKVPLKKIFFLKHAKKNTAKKIAPMEATSRLIVCSFPTFWDKKGMEFTLSFCAELAEKVPCYELGFVPDESVLDFVEEVRF